MEVNSSDDDCEEGPKYDRAAQTEAAHKRLRLDIDQEMEKGFNDEWERLVQSSKVRTSKSSLSLPWERGFASMVFGEDKPTLFRDLPEPREVPDITSIGSGTTATTADADHLREHVKSIPGAWKAVAHRIGNLKFHLTKEEARQAALAKWKRILLMDSSKSELGRKLIGQLLKFQNDGFLDQVVKDVFARKSTATLSKRANHLLEYAGWCESQGLSFLPLSEGDFYKFLLEVRSLKAATAPKSSKEAVAFSISTLGLDGSKQIVESSLINGLCHRVELTKKPTKRAVTLTRKQVLCLERTLFNPQCWLPDRVFAGHSLWALYGRLRWEDSLWSTGLVIDENAEGQGYVESQALGTTKTAITAQQKTTFLPQVAPINGLEMQNWPRKWIELRRLAGLEDAGSVDGKGNLLPLLSEVNSAGKFSKNPISASKASAWLKELLETSPDSSKEAVSGNSSHALKSTTLAWVSKHGSCDPYTRKLLGYHADSSENSMHTYSRDVLSQPLRDYERVILAVAEGTFDPDSTRSGYFKPKPKAFVNLDCEVRVGGEVAFGSQNSDPTLSRKERALVNYSDEVDLEVKQSSSSSDSSGTSDSVDPFVSALKSNPLTQIPKATSGGSSSSRGPATALGEVRVCHIRLKTMHSVHKDDPAKLACGRLFHEGFKLVDDLSLTVLADYPHCAGCFGSAKSN